VRGLIERLRTESGDPYVLGLVRVGIGGFLFWHALGAARELSEVGYFGASFHLPFLDGLTAPSRTVYVGILALRMLLAVMVTVGLAARPALLGSALLGLYVLLLDRLQFHHNRYSLLLFAFLLSFTRCDQSLSLAAPPGLRMETPLWAVRLMQVQVSLMYLASGGSKLLDRDWREGLVIGDRLMRFGEQAIARGVPPGFVHFLQAPHVSSALAKMAIITELFLCVALWLRKSRVLALWWGVMFHLTIQVTSRVEIFTWLMLVLYALFVTPDVRARKLFYNPRRLKGVALGWTVRLLDWFLRFDVRAWTPDEVQGGHSIVVVRRDGSLATGVRARAMIARTVPLLFPLWAPLALVASFTRKGDLHTAV
jgi:hypothetical protein